MKHCKATVMVIVLCVCVVAGSDLPPDCGHQESGRAPEGSSREHPPEHERSQQCPCAASHHGVRGAHTSSHSVARAVARGTGRCLQVGGAQLEELGLIDSRWESCCGVRWVELKGWGLYVTQVIRACFYGDKRCGISDEAGHTNV